MFLWINSYSRSAQGSKWLSDKSVWLVFGSLGFESKLDPEILSVDLFHTLFYS